jgi:hypothetical protein
LEDLRKYIQEGTPKLKESKPGTVLFLAYTSQDGGEVSFLHVFPNAQAMDDHLLGVAERTQSAYGLIQPRSFEIYAKPSSESLEIMKQNAAQAGAQLIISADFLDGYLRLKEGGH